MLLYNVIFSNRHTAFKLITLLYRNTITYNQEKITIDNATFYARI